MEIRSSPLLRPVRMHLGMNRAIVAGIGVSFGAGVDLLGVFLIQEPDVTLLVLDAVFVKIGVHAFGTPAIILGNGADGDEILAVQNNTIVTGLGAKFRNLLILDSYGIFQRLCRLPFCFECRECIDGKVGILNQIVHRIKPMLTDGRQHLRSHPLLEAFSGGKFAAEDEAVKTALVDDGHFLHTAKGALNWGILFILLVNVGGNRITRFGISQHLGYIPSHKIGFIIDGQCTHGAIFEVPNLNP